MLFSQIAVELDSSVVALLEFLVSTQHAYITMTVAYELAHRGLATPTNTGGALEDRFEVLKDIGDGSFGSVVLARVRGAGSNIARRGTVVSIITNFVCSALLIRVPRSPSRR